MASQAKITGFFRPTKASSSSAAAAKRRKAVIEDPICEVESKCDIKPTVASLKQETIAQFVNEPGVLLKSDLLKTESGPIDNHGCIPVSTPKGTTGLTTSCRKRKMQCVDEQSEVISKTPEKLPEKSDAGIELSTKVRKKLEMGNEKVAAIQASEEVKIKADLLNSPSKPVTFLCMGTLSPRKPGLNSPIHVRSSPLVNKLSTEKLLQNIAEKRFKSPAVKSLASLLDKVAPTKELPTKLTSEEVKARLGNSKNLAELRAKLSKVNNCSETVKEFYESKVHLKKFSNLEFNLSVPVSPSKQSPVKRQPQVEKRPAFERFHALAQAPSEHLVLPFKYKVLNEVFRCIETVVAMLYNRKECINFTKLKPAVQKMLQRDFTEKHLAQVCHVFPSAYKINYEKLVANLRSSPVKNRTYHLTLAPRLNYLSPKLLDEEESDDLNEDQKSFQPLAPTMLVERRYIFHNRLIKITKGHHTEFLANYNPLLQVSEDKVTRWHQNFDVDGVPEIPLANLPTPPDVKTFATAKDVLEQAHNLAMLNPRLEAALKKCAVSKDSTVPVKNDPLQDIEASKPAPPPVNAGLKGVSQSLIDKIRAREAAKAQTQMTMNTEEIRRQGIAKLLPELARIINSIFVTEKKSVIALRPLIEKIQYSHRGIMSTSAVEEHIKLLRKVYPEWLDILSRGGIDYVKVDRKIDSNIVYQKLEDNAKS
ncbi:DNA replication factor Cdt1-like isoform X2 [Daphnia pulicaria]|uniref:DNA replication factor Cdt1-like isoform X2 n=1 Tax=Daphnia pulicaria TaxID=35523 RepID=UPI001EEC3648|nr:DNA replication factor Cdt1-like isoform X2 [Daphnia pulicaria]